LGLTFRGYTGKACISVIAVLVVRTGASAEGTPPREGFELSSGTEGKMTLTSEVPVTFESVVDASFQIRWLAGPRLCRTPCTLRLEPGIHRLEATADDLVTVSAHVLVRDKHLAIEVHSVDSAHHTTGVVLLGAGAGAMAFGVLWLVLQELWLEPLSNAMNIDNPEHTRTDYPEERPLMVLSVGAVLGLAGLVAIADEPLGFRKAVNSARER